jgi:hypothetical protein
MVLTTIAHVTVDIRKPISYDHYGKLIGHSNSNLLHYQHLSPYTVQIEKMIQDPEIEFFAVIQYCNGYSEYLRSFFYKESKILQNLHVKLDFGCEFGELKDGQMLDFLGCRFKTRKVASYHYCFYRIDLVDR